MTPRAIKLAARLIAEEIITEAIRNSYIPLCDELFEGRITEAESDALFAELGEIAARLRKKDMKLSSVREIIQYARVSPDPDRQL